MLTLFTYADIKAVNPEALTSWKAEMLWQLYAATENYLNRSVDDQRMYLAGEDAQQLERLVPKGEDAWRRRGSEISWMAFRAAIF